MSWTRNYFELKVGATTLQFRLLLEEANMRGVLQLAMHQRNLDGQMVSVRSSLQPRSIKGFALLKYDETAPFGTLDQLLAWWNSDTLEVRGMADASFWAAVIIGDWNPRPLEQTDRYCVVEITIEQKQ